MSDIDGWDSVIDKLVVKALRLGDCTSRDQWITLYPGQHCWIDYYGRLTCAICYGHDDDAPCRPLKFPARENSK